MVAILAVIQKQRGRLADVQGHNVHTAVVIEVAKSHSSAGVERNASESGARRNFLEGSIAQIAEEKQRLAKVRGIGNGIDLRVDVTIGGQNIEPAVIVHVEKAGTPTDKGMAGLRDL